MDQIYTDFTTKLLPKIAEGFTMTKEYFMDLFGRYAHFLFIQDVIYTSACLLGAIISLLIAKYCSDKNKKYVNYYSDWEFGIIIGILASAVFIGFAIDNAINAVKDKYIPEVRVYEELKGFNK